SGVVDAGAYGLVVILSGVVAGLRGDVSGPSDLQHHAPPSETRPHHGDSRYRYCTNFIVTGAGLESRSFVPRLEELGDSVLVVGDEATIKVHVHTDEPDAAKALFAGAGAVSREDIADMHLQVADQRAKLTDGQSAAVAVASGDGMRSLF